MNKKSMLRALLFASGFFLLTGVAVAENDGAARELQLNQVISQVREKATKVDTASAQDKAALKATLFEAVRQAISGAKTPQEAARIIAAAVAADPRDAAAITRVAVRASPAYAAAISGAAAAAAPDQAAAITQAAVTETPSRAAAIQRSVTQAAPTQAQAIYLAAISVPGVNPITLVAPVTGPGTNNGANSNGVPDFVGNPPGRAASPS